MDMSEVTVSPISLAASSAFSSDRMELTLFPTEKCQFRCTYCYEDFAIGRMPKKVIEGVKKLITERSKDLSELYLSWFGGEPLLACDIIQAIMKHAQETCKENSVYLKGSMTTNGDLLTVQLLGQLIEKRVVHYQISLDGPKKYHDKTRVRVNGQGSFDSIWQNLLDAKNSDLEFEILLRLHITPDNGNDILEFCAMLCETFVKNDSRFGILPMVVGDWGGPNSGKIATFGGNEGDFLLRETQSIISQNIAALVRNDIAIEPSEVCYAAKPNSFLIRANGDVAKCTVALSNKANRIGSLNSDGSLDLNQELARKWLGGWEKLDEDVLGCPLGDVIASTTNL